MNVIACAIIFLAACISDAAYVVAGKKNPYAVVMDLVAWGAIFLAAFFFITSPAHAGKVHSQSGVFATVADSAVPQFQCLINQLELQRYPIKYMRGCGKGSVRGSLHPACLALDINQTRRHVTVPRMPSNEIAMANACGLISGAQWRDNPDSGHFQFGGWSGKYAGRVRHAARKVHTKAPKARGFFDWLFNR